MPLILWLCIANETWMATVEALPATPKWTIGLIIFSVFFRITVIHATQHEIGKTRRHAFQKRHPACVT